MPWTIASATASGTGSLRFFISWRIARTSWPCTNSIVKKYWPSVLADVVDVRDVRVLQRRGEPRLVEEHLHERRVLGDAAAGCA